MPYKNCSSGIQNNAMLTDFVSVKLYNKGIVINGVQVQVYAISSISGMLSGTTSNSLG